MATKVTKDKDENLDYGFNFTPVISGDTIQSSTWTQVQGDANLVLGTTGTNGNETFIWLSGGTNGMTYKIVNRVTMTPSTRVFDRTLQVKIAEK